MKRGRDKRERSGKGRDRRMKKALAGPAKRTSKRLPERRAMIAAARRRIAVVLSAAGRRSLQLDRAVARRIEQLRPPLARRLTRLRAVAVGWLGRGRKVVVRVLGVIGRWLRPLVVLTLRAFSRLERVLLPAHRARHARGDPGQRDRHPPARDLRRDRRLGRLPRRRPVRRIPQRRGRSGRPTPACRRPRRRPSATRRRATLTPTC